MSGVDVLDQDPPFGRAHRVVVPVQEAQADDAINGVVVGELEDVDLEIGEREAEVENVGTLIK